MSFSAVSRDVSVPAQPWAVEKASSATLLATVEAGPKTSAIVPVRYRKDGPPVAHAWFENGIPAYDLRVERETNVLLLPRNIALSESGELLKRNFSPVRIPNENLVRMDEEDRYNARSPVDDLNVRVVGRPALVMDSSWPRVYGHVLLELLPMLMLREHLPDDAMLLTSAPLSRTLLLLAGALGFPADRISQIEGPVLCSEAYYVDPPIRLGRSVHPLAFEAFERLRSLASDVTISSRSRIYVSRQNARARPLREQRAIEELFQQYGFVVFHPERADIEDQIAVFAAAKMFAGPVGSGLHNTVFSEPSTSMLLLKSERFPIGMNIALSKSPSRVGYVDGQPTSDKSVWGGPWSIDLADVEAGIRQHFGL